MQHVESWRALYRCDDLNKARTVATCLAAMEYDVELHGLCGPVEIETDSAGCFAPFEVRVPATDWASLAEVLDEIIEEQEQFDELVGSLEQRVSQAERRLLVTMIIVVSTLAVAGAIDL
ncbi:MAG: hypothetical protein ACYTJ0_03135 [Planctomycetota bacterium]|jgi:hypothetical protein